MAAGRRTAFRDTVTGTVPARRRAPAGAVEQSVACPPTTIRVCPSSSGRARTASTSRNRRRRSPARSPVAPASSPIATRAPRHVAAPVPALVHGRGHDAHRPRRVLEGRSRAAPAAPSPSTPKPRRTRTPPPRASAATSSSSTCRATSSTTATTSRARRRGSRNPSAARTTRRTATRSTSSSIWCSTRAPRTWSCCPPFRLPAAH